MIRFLEIDSVEVLRDDSDKVEFEHVPSCPGCGGLVTDGTARCNHCRAHICTGCGAPVDKSEEGRCAFCRMDDRGDGALLTHDARGWLATVSTSERQSPAKFEFLAQFWTERVERRVPCGCGCGMTKADLPKPEVEPVVHEAPKAVPLLIVHLTNQQIIDAIRDEATSFLDGKPPSIEHWRQSGRKPAYSTIIARFGTWNEAIRAAGFEPCVHGHPYTPENTYTYLKRGRTHRRCRQCQREAWHGRKAQAA